MNETQKKRYQYITAPATVVAAFAALAWMIVSRTTLNNRVQSLEDFKSEVNLVEIQSTLTAMQKDIEWIRIQLQK